MPKCVICGGLDFYAEAGFYFCKECQTQNEDAREEVLELRADAGTRIRKIRIRQDKSITSEQNLGWTTWEQYNFILIGLTNELIELGASQEIKMTILQLWSFYLSKLEVAFTSTEKRNVPKLARTFHKRDAEIIYGKIARRKKSRRSMGSNTSASSVVSGAISQGSSNRDSNKQKKRMITAEYERFVQSQNSSEGDGLSVMNQSLFSVQSSTGRSSIQTEDNIRFNKAAKKESKKIKTLSKKLPRLQRTKYRENHTTTQYKMSPEVLTPMKLWSLIYLALRIHDENIHLADMLRYGREGHLSYYRLDHLLPPEVTLSKKETNLLHQTKEITHKGMRQSIGAMAKFLQVWEVKKPYVLSLIDRYCIELQLPKGIAIYAERMMALSPPRMPFNAKTVSFPNYEGRAMAFIIVILKILFALDGITEYEISRVAELLNKHNAENLTLATLPPEIIEPCIIVHGGIIAEYSLNPVFVEMVEACKISASLGYQKILSGGNSTDAVEAALWWLENDEFFNCGYGSVLNKEGYVEMDAGLINGARMECGTVVSIQDNEHPISLARFVMENFPNSIMRGKSIEELARIVKKKSITPEVIISPVSYFSNETKYPPSMEYFDNHGRLNDSNEILKTCNLGAVGCIAWDGSSMVAGTSTGGSKNKMVGRVSDSSLLGCGFFADENSACCLTGPGESIIKIGLARNIVEDLSTEKSSPKEILKKHLDALSNNSDDKTGGIVFRKNGSSAVYCNDEKYHPMPYAVIKNSWITCPLEGGEKKMEKYEDPDKKHSFASKNGILESRLFSFCEWQRYIECRRTIISNVHFPTKLKRDPQATGNTHLYLKFLAGVRAKSNDREEPLVTSYKHLLPRELSDAMKKIIDKLNETGSSVQKEVEIFAPSLTPQYSYFQQLLENPEKDLPSNLRIDFHSTKVGYITKPKALRALADRCKIDLKIKDTGLHFLEKIVPTFTQSDLPNIEEFNETTSVEKIVLPKNQRDSTSQEICENIDEYLHRKNPGSIFIDLEKHEAYENINRKENKYFPETMTNSLDDFGFDEILPNGKLVVQNCDEFEDNLENSMEKENCQEDELNCKEKTQSTMDFLAKYNLSLSNFEKNHLDGNLSVDSTRILREKAKRQIIRDPLTGKFLPGVAKMNSKKRNEKSESERKMKIEKSKEKSETKIDVKKLTKKLEIETKTDFERSKEENSKDEKKLTERWKKDDEDLEKENNLDSSYDFGLEDDDISILKENSFESTKDEILEENLSESFDSLETLFRPYSDYWMLRCNFSRVKQKNFRQLEKNLPANFRWLLEECCSVVEMTEEDLYKEVCLIEIYYNYILKSKNNLSDTRHENHPSKADCNDVRKKW